MTNIIWTPERIQKLVELWMSGCSASEVSRQFDLIVSRSAVIGKVHRLGIQRGPKTRHSPRRPSRVPVGTPRSQNLKPLPTALQRPLMGWPLEVDPMIQVVDEPAPIAQRKTVETLTNSCCRWPVGDPGTADFHFCGANRIPGLPYCDTHAKRAYTPTYYQQKAVGWAGRGREKVGAE